MRPYNVEFFTPELNFIANTNIDSLTYKEDFLSPETNTVKVEPLKVSRNDYIRIEKNGNSICGIVSGISFGDDSMMEVAFKPLITLFDTGIVFPVDAQREGTFEKFIKDTAEGLFISNPDACQNISGLSVEAVTETPEWYLHITPSDKGGHFNVVNFLDSVLIPAFTKYGIRVDFSLDPNEKKIKAEIRRNLRPSIRIEADLPNIIKKNIAVRQTNVDTNKLIIYDTTGDYAESTVYYLHPDLSYDKEDKDRMMPVRCAVKTVTSGEESSFKSLCEAVASDTFSGIKYNNLIELTVMNDDTLVNPQFLEPGQEVEVISGGESFISMLTGKETGDMTKLTFGTVRMDFTKILRREING